MTLDEFLNTNRAKKMLSIEHLIELFVKMGSHFQYNAAHCFTVNLEENLRLLKNTAHLN